MSAATRLPLLVNGTTSAAAASSLSTVTSTFPGLKSSSTIHPSISTFSDRFTASTRKIASRVFSSVAASATTMVSHAPTLVTNSARNRPIATAAALVNSTVRPGFNQSAMAASTASTTIGRFVSAGISTIVHETTSSLNNATMLNDRERMMADEELQIHDAFNSSRSQYTCDGHGVTARGQTLLFPIFDESTWPNELRTLLYILGLLNVFVGVSYGVDVFMGAIEKISLHTIMIKVKNPKAGEPEYKRVAIWNQTVATLTLGAAGTCSPEILLTTIETIGHGFDSGRLGPGTIIGSAAFNLMVTAAFCIISVPTPQTRRIEALPVYITTTVFSIFAYLWLIYVLAGPSRKIVEIWEAAVTFGFFFVLVISAYVVDRKCGSRHHENSTETQTPEGHSVAGNNTIMITNGSMLPHHNGVSGVVNTQNGTTRVATADYTDLKLAQANGRTPTNGTTATGSGKPRSGPQNSRGQVKRLKKQRSWLYYRTHRPPPFSVNRIADVGMLNMHMVIANLVTQNGGHHPSTPDTVHAVVQFPSKLFYATPNVRTVRVPVLRKGNLQLQCTVLHEVYADGMTGRPRKSPLADALVFSEGETEKSITVDVPYRFLATVDNGKFHVRLSLADNNPPHVTLGAFSEMEIVLSPDAEQLNTAVNSNANNISDSTTTASNDPLQQQQGTSTAVSDENSCESNGSDEYQSSSHDEEDIYWQDAWKLQFRKSVQFNSTGKATWFDYMTYVFVVWWRMILAFVPPPQIGGGYPTFFVALMFIAVLETIVGDMATIFGCLLGIHEVVVAAMLVSVGTNLPDLFASRFAAISDKSADTAIGHISGGCCVNVFLGLGVPWLIGSIYQGYKGKDFYVPVEDLWNCVVAYSLLSIVSIVILCVRRKVAAFGNAELGGPKRMKILTAIVLFCMWLSYVGFTYCQTKDVCKIPFDFSIPNEASTGSEGNFHEH